MSQQDNNNREEGLIAAHKDVAECTREIAQHLVGSIAKSIPDEHHFRKMIQQSDRASLTLQRLSSILGHLIPLEHRILDKQKAASTKRRSNRGITKVDCEIVVNLAKQWGILKEGSEEQIDKILNKYMKADLITEEQDDS